MAENRTIESPDFDRIRTKTDYAVADAIQLLWEALNEEAKLRRLGVRQAIEQDTKKVLVSGATTNQDNFDSEGAGIIEFTGSSAFNLTGIRNGVEGQRITLHNLGSGTITLKHNVTSDSANRLFMDTSADKSLPQLSSVVFLYLNGSWKEMNLL